MSESPYHLSLEPVRRGEDNGTGDRWNAYWGIDDHVEYDGAGATVEEALVELVFAMGGRIEELELRLHEWRSRP